MANSNIVDCFPNAHEVLQRVVFNTLSDRIGHNPNETEVAACLSYLDDNLDLTTVSLDWLNDGIDDYVADNYVQCEECGEYFPVEQTEEVPGPALSVRRVCTRGCAAAVYDERMDWLGDTARHAVYDD